MGMFYDCDESNTKAQPTAPATIEHSDTATVCWCDRCRVTATVHINSTTPATAPQPVYQTGSHFPLPKPPLDGLRHYVFMAVEDALRVYKDSIPRMSGGDNMIQHTVTTAVMNVFAEYQPPLDKKVQRLVEAATKLKKIADYMQSTTPKAHPLNIRIKYSGASMDIGVKADFD